MIADLGGGGIHDRDLAARAAKGPRSEIDDKRPVGKNHRIPRRKHIDQDQTGQGFRRSMGQHAGQRRWGGCTGLSRDDRVYRDATPDTGRRHINRILAIAQR